ncbi:MAG: modC [Frankiales bacterium]|nr:modC [Frankiales bacterium]
MRAELGVDRDAFSLDVVLDAEPGEVLALVGPNGAGKTTALRALAGLLPLTRGRLAVGGQVLDDPAAGVFVPPELRRVGLVPQDHLLLPHLSAVQNVAYGLRARGLRKPEALARALAGLDGVGLADRADARPRELSGGQAQRVALARALVTEPALLVLDEPLAALDAVTRLDVRTDLRAHLEDFAGVTVLVTHDAVDALVLADRLAVLDAGRVVQEGCPAEVAASPQDDYVAELVGLVLLRGIGRGPCTDLHGVELAVPATGEVLVAVAPSAVGLSLDGPGFAVTVRGVEQHGSSVRVRLDGPPDLVADVPAARVAELGLHRGQRVRASVAPQDVAVYAASTPRSRRSLAR